MDKIKIGQILSTSFDETDNDGARVYSLAKKDAQSLVSSQRVDIGTAITADFDRVSIEIGSSKTSPVDRIYPHAFDKTTNAGRVVALIERALVDARLATEAFGEPDIAAVSTHLTNVAAVLKTAFAMIDFNKSLGPVVSFIRRATLTTSADGIDRLSLNTLTSVLQSIRHNPMIDLDDASELFERLSNDGWRGEIKAVDSLIALLLADGEDGKVRADQALPAQSSQ